MHGDLDALVFAAIVTSYLPVLHSLLLSSLRNRPHLHFHFDRRPHLPARRWVYPHQLCNQAPPPRA